MHVQQLERLPAVERSSVLELDRLVGRLRRRLGLECLATSAIRGVLASSVAAMGLSIGIWLTGADQNLLWLSAAPLLAALIFGLVRWPSRRSTAMTVDSRYGLGERLATALELARGERSSRFAEIQVQDAVARTHSARGGWLHLDRRARNEAVLAMTVAVLAIAVMILTARLERPASTPPPVAESTVEDAPPLADDLTQRGVPLEASQEPVATAVPARPAAANADLATQVQQEQAERSALDALAQALNGSSAGKAAADAIQQGDYNAARDQLQNLADNADQLSNGAKQQLARGLQQAAAATAQSDRALADREQQAAQALARSNYAEQRQALGSLADQVQRSGSRSVPSDQLERDVGQLQQQSSAGATSSAATARSTAGGGQQSSDGQAGGAQGGQDANGQQGGQQGGGTATSGQNGAGAGEQIGRGVGNGTDPNLYADQPSKLDSAGQQVQVPLKLGSGQAARPADGTEDQAAPDPTLGGRTTAELAQQQQTGQVTPEQNLVRGEQRPVVRGYFR